MILCNLPRSVTASALSEFEQLQCYWNPMGLGLVPHCILVPRMSDQLIELMVHENKIEGVASAALMGILILIMGIFARQVY